MNLETLLWSAPTAQYEAVVVEGVRADYVGVGAAAVAVVVRTCRVCEDRLVQMPSLTWTRCRVANCGPLRLPTPGSRRAIRRSPPRIRHAPGRTPRAR